MYYANHNSDISQGPYTVKPQQFEHQWLVFHSNLFFSPNEIFPIAQKKNVEGNFLVVS